MIKLIFRCDGNIYKVTGRNRVAGGDSIKMSSCSCEMETLWHLGKKSNTKFMYKGIECAGSMAKAVAIPDDLVVEEGDYIVG